MVTDQSDSSTFRFDFSGINWSKDDPVSIVNAYREALKRQEQQKKRRLLENQIATNSYRDLGSVESSATISPTIPSVTGSNRDRDNIANGDSYPQSQFVNGSHEIDLSQPPSNTDSQVSEKRKRPSSASPEERRSGIKSALEVFWNPRRVASKLSVLQRNRRNIRKYAPPPYFAQLRRPRDKINSGIGAVTDTGDNYQDSSSQSSTASVTIPGGVPGQATSDDGSLPSSSTAGFLNVPLSSSSRPLYVDSITQTDTAIYGSNGDRKRRLDVSDITPERKKRPGFFSAIFEDSDEEPREAEVEEPLLKKRRLFAHDGVTLASSPVFYRTRLVSDSPYLSISPRKSRATESDIAGRRLKLEQEEREQQQEEREERLRRERQEKEAELEQQRKVLEEERKRQEVKQKELEEKERQLKDELLNREQQRAKSSTHSPAVADASDNSKKGGFTTGAISVPAQPNGMQTSTDTIKLATPSFNFGLPASTPSDKKASGAPSVPTSSVSSSLGTTAASTHTATAETKSDQRTSTSSSAPAFQFGLKSSTDTIASPFTPSTGLPFASTSVSVPPTTATSDAAAGAPSTFSFGLTSAPSTTPTFSFSPKSAESTKAGSTSASATASTPALAFSFGKASSPLSASTTSSATTGPSITAFATGSNKASTSASFSHSVSSAAASTTQAATAPSLFSFGASTTSSAPPLFGGFGAASSSTSTTGVSSAPSFTFPAGPTNTAMQINGSGGSSASAPVFGSTTAPSTPAQPSTSLFNFASSTANPAAVFGFGNTSAEASPAPVAANGLTSSTPNTNIFASPAPAGTPPPGRKLAPMRGRLRRR
ncbi:hypothetical protein V1509DRAFT_674592 [Lipomyces kononenkoae]